MSSMGENSRIYVAGHAGLAGSAIVRALERAGCGRLILRRHAELDLADAAATRAFFERERPEQVFVAAARAGGIVANDTYPADFIQQNLAIELNAIHEAWRAGAKRLLFLGSSCIYPRDCPQPMKEEYLLTGPLEPTNEGYAIAKIAGLKLCEYISTQFNKNFISCVPCNIYGEGDYFDTLRGHVIGSLLVRMHVAKTSGAETVAIWGT